MLSPQRVAFTCALTLGISAAALSPAEATSTVVALYHLDELPGTPVALDSSPFAHDGAVSADVTQGVPGDPTLPPPNTAYNFTGLNPIVRVPDSDSLDPASAPLLLSAHLRVPATLTAGDYNVVQKGTATAIGGAYKLEIVGNAASTKFGYPDCAFNSSATPTTPKAKNRAYGPQRINDSTWHTVTCHLTPTEVYVTVDGVSGRHLARTVTSIANASPLTMGGKPNNTHYFNGDLDEVSISIG